MWKARCWLGQPKSEVRVLITPRAQPEVFCTLTLLEGFAPTITQKVLFYFVDLFEKIF